ncbi:MAG: DUF4340 domain-containing protein [Myxococcota bacterium]|nr:DUF4340 domain-containing protein [Myxococcota bacterium]
MDKSLVGHTALAVVAAIAAYVAWTKPSPGKRDPSIVVVAGSADRLTQVEWDDTGFHVTVDNDDGKLAVSSTVKNSKDEKRNVSGFPATEKSHELLKRLAPLKAERSLGKVEGPRLKEVGLEEPKQSLVLHFGDKPVKLDVGDAAFGTGSYYVRQSTGEVFLVPSESIQPFRGGAAGLIERMAVNLTREHVEQLTVTSEGSSRTLVHKNAADRAQSFFADKSTPDTKIEKASTWVDAVLRLRALSQAPEAPAGEPKLTVTLRGDDGRERMVKVYEPANETATVVSTTFPKGVLVAKSTAELLLKDAKQVLAEPASSEPRASTP